MSSFVINTLPAFSSIFAELNWLARTLTNMLFRIFYGKVAKFQ
jgi:hypothetical protein